MEPAPMAASMAVTSCSVWGTNGMAVGADQCSSAIWV
jgi:hypothetical protein